MGPQPVMAVIRGWHNNARVVDDAYPVPTEALALYLITPGPTHRRWAKSLPHPNSTTIMSLGTILIIILLLILLGGFPTKGYGGGHYVNGGVGLVLVVIIILFLLGKL